MQQIRLWEITPDQRLVEIAGNAIPLEERLEEWLESDISVLDPNLLVIGRQVDTDYGGTIDLLCLDSAGDTVVIELKKGKTPREVAAQALDYASWVKDLSFEQLVEIADKYFESPGLLPAKFQERFDANLPRELNQEHKSLVVGERMDASTKRIVQYLSDLKVPINMVTVQHFKDEDGREMLAQVYLIEPEVAEERSRSASKRRGVTLADLQSRAERNGIGDMFRIMREGIRGILLARPYSESILYVARLADGGQRTVLIVGSGSTEQGRGLGFIVHASRFGEHLGVSEEQLREWLPEGTTEGSVRGWAGSSPEERLSARGLEGSFQTVDEVEKFLAGLRTLRQSQDRE